MKINELAKISGVSTRALRYYDEIGLLSPAMKNDAGYRIYSQKEIDLLQQILFYRALDMKLEQIKDIIHAPNFNVMNALESHRQHLLEKNAMIQQLLQTVDHTIEALQEGIIMSNEEKFKGFKEQLIQENEEKYGEEIRARYGDETIDASNAKLLGLTEQQFEEMGQLEQSLFARLHEAMADGNPSSELGNEVAELHKRWLMFSWKDYSKEAHAGLAAMYVADERFTAYYDERVTVGASQFLHDCIVVYATK
ncbi:MerR family transcriptional regulator [Metasolibacillus meyeri]|uniref:MerR family transcriptional regulator n=1 Tax=Metasolibacillus meyeri TaxID=1071052 RepID=A0AAW9NXN4_9BACL|nr:MerR family transcriptional regulator [Metasolibacillus meyeri]MEC1180286.1 MerR family transcriptional regulator [Metasolibacillus meyeri]